ncbi:phosphatidylserine/phosphatidylglycerophosphate/cardiolipin synthase-like enzyme [Paraburkholderia sp. GAS333]|uniref:phospholipase D-like domain-containing protein n=1 Tax=Paraburkholderia sp. GAS333 TaxID=3156279 RepID=UPI003D253AC5
MSTKCIAFSNNDVILIAWTFADKLKDCVGCDVRRIPASSANTASDEAQGESLPAMASFPGDPAAGKGGRTTAQAPIQKLFWKDLYVTDLASPGPYIYQIIPLKGSFDAKGVPTLTPYPDVRPLFSNPVTLSEDHGPTGAESSLKAYFNRGILATQALTHEVPVSKRTGAPDKGALLKRIADPKDALRKSLASDLLTALPALLVEANKEGGNCYAALYELNDEELESYLIGNKRLHLILSNTFDSDSGDPDKENKPARKSLHQSGVDILDRILPDGSHIGHNKFVLYLDGKGKPAAVLTGSTNWTSTGLCAQTNNSLIIRSPSVAQAYSDYWDRLKQDTDDANGDAHALQGKTFRTENETPVKVDVPGAAEATVWYSPNTLQKNKPKNPTAPVDMAAVEELIKAAKHAVLFLCFDPGKPSVIEAAAEALVANPNLFIRGALTNVERAGNFVIDLHDNNRKPDDPAQVIPATAIDDTFGMWEKELLNAGHAVIHDKIVVIDPFDPKNCTVVVGSHNLGYKASFTNDENFLVIKGNQSLARAYTVHVLDVYDHYRWRYLLAQYGTKDSWQGLQPNDNWQNKYFPASGKKPDAELTFWLSASD